MPSPGRRPTQAVFVISVAADLAGVHPQTLRTYERRGLLDPARTRGGSRRYSQEDIEQLRRIHDLTADGLNLAGVKRVMALEAELARLHDELAATRTQAAEAITAANRGHRRDLVPLSQAIEVFGRRR